MAKRGMIFSLKEERAKSRELPQLGIVSIYDVRVKGKVVGTWVPHPDGDVHFFRKRKVFGGFAALVMDADNNWMFSSKNDPALFYVTGEPHELPELTAEMLAKHLV